MSCEVPPQPGATCSLNSVAHDARLWEECDVRLNLTARIIRVHLQQHRSGPVHGWIFSQAGLGSVAFPHDFVAAR